MTTSVPIFCSLTDLVDWTHGTPPSLQCAYLVKHGSPCKNKISQTKSQFARSLFASHLVNLTAPGRCILTTAIHQSQIFQELADNHVCKTHGRHLSAATRQWQREFYTTRTQVISRLERYYNLEIDDTHPEDEIGDEEQPFPHGSNGREGEVQDEKYASEAEEDVSILSSQSPSQIRAIRRSLTFDENEVAKYVTWVLRQRVEGNAAKYGWVYVIRPCNLSGKFKIGYTLDNPHQGRLKYHKNCYGDFDVIKTKLTPYAFRVEQLLLAEFSNRQYTLEDVCPKHRTRHKELLDIDQANLLESLKKWVDFAKSPSYDKNSGKLLAEAISKLPPPSSKEYLKCGRPRRRVSTNPTPLKKQGDQNFQVTPPPALTFRDPTSTAKSCQVDAVELDPDELLSKLEDFEISSSANDDKYENNFERDKEDDEEEDVDEGNDNASSTSSRW
ncbi:hypothetical protein N7510_011622 [Penicillium lagena]|uniref:uncharacterized protein n=1 Tax=Penicillium lagena TaxID=94218 RepID=UPI00253FD31F|nr:uncharacterized protein N7510_011622 [Penicillium lagena]KAJ5602088.1 hypothetical protein N7510_011622 [Penicillium lagena]